MRKNQLNKENKVPKDIQRMGLGALYIEYLEYCKIREKTHEKIFVKNPTHYKSKAYKVDIWNKKEDLFEITAETMFGRKEVFKKEDLYNY